jgi:hypothetical protein
MFVAVGAGGYTVIVGRGRTVALSVALAFLLAFAGACSSSGSSKSAPKGSTAAHARAVATARAKKVARHRKVVAHRRAVKQRRARAALARRRARHVKSVRLAALRSTPASDLTAITRSVNRLNAAFGRSVRRGIQRAAALNYWAATGVYTRRECRAFAANAGEGLVAEQLVVHPETLTATPGWTDPSVGRAPSGRIYVVAVDEIQTFVPTGEQRVLAQQLRASVSRGRARLFFRCV